jgi:hypothetical protein
VEHPKRVVRYPSTAGSVVGGIVGIPAEIVAFPVSAVVFIVGENVDPREERWAVGYVWATCRDTGSILFGGIPWLCFGWWGEESDKPQPDLVSVTLDEVSAYDAIRMGKRISSGLYFTKDSIPKEELDKIVVSVNVKDVTMQEYLRQVASSAGLKIEIVNAAGLLRVTRKQN